MRPRTIERREFLTTTGVAAAAMWTGPAKLVFPGPPGASAIRTISYNVLACRGFNGKEGDRAAVARMAPQIPARIALELALHQPDIVTFQESPREAVVADIAKRMGMDYAYFPGGYPGSVLSRFPIVESKNCPLAEGERPSDLFTRHWGKAVLRMEDQDLVVYTAHLYPGQDGHERALVAMWREGR